MGNTTSEPYEGPPEWLSECSLEGIAEWMGSDVCEENVFVMCGAGISTSAGIPDFRSPKTGLYANLARLNLPRPEAVFDIDYFRTNPQPFFTLAQEIAPGRFVPTPAHLFIRLLHEKGLLHTCFTQNIDTLERLAGVPSDKIIEAHGSFASSRCISCKAKYDHKKMEAAIAEARVVHCEEEGCGGLVKPDIVFFGEPLPREFGAAAPSVTTAGLVIVMGTSLQVQPFSTLPTIAESCPRLLINLNPVGDFGTRSDDVLFLAECDAGVRKLCDLLNWTQDLERLTEEMKTRGIGASLGTTDEGGKGGEADLLAEHLAEEISKKLKLEDDSTARPAKNPETKAPLDEKPVITKPLLAPQASKTPPIDEYIATGIGLEPAPPSNTVPPASTADSSAKNPDTTIPDDTKSTP